MGHLIEIHADLIKSELPAIGQGVNVRGVMGAGISGPLMKLYPNMHFEYRAACRNGLLVPGGFTSHVVPETAQVIYSLASQENPGADATYTWLDRSVRGALRDMEIRGLKTLGLPRIGCGIGGLDWKRVQATLARACHASYVDIVVCNWP